MSDAQNNDLANMSFADKTRRLNELLQKLEVIRSEELCDIDQMLIVSTEANQVIQSLEQHLEGIRKLQMQHANGVGGSEPPPAE